MKNKGGDREVKRTGMEWRDGERGAKGMEMWSGRLFCHELGKTLAALVSSTSFAKRSKSTPAVSYDIHSTKRRRRGRKEEQQRTGSSQKDPHQARRRKESAGSASSPIPSPSNESSKPLPPLHPSLLTPLSIPPRIPIYQDGQGPPEQLGGRAIAGVLRDAVLGHQCLESRFPLILAAPEAGQLRKATHLVRAQQLVSVEVEPLEDCANEGTTAIADQLDPRVAHVYLLRIDLELLQADTARGGGRIGSISYSGSGTREEEEEKEEEEEEEEPPPMLTPENSSGRTALCFFWYIAHGSWLLWRIPLRRSALTMLDQHAAVRGTY